MPEYMWKRTFASVDDLRRSLSLTTEAAHKIDAALTRARDCWYESGEAETLFLRRTAPAHDCEVTAWCFDNGVTRALLADMLGKPVVTS